MYFVDLQVEWDEQKTLEECDEVEENINSITDISISLEMPLKIELIELLEHFFEGPKRLIFQIDQILRALMMIVITILLEEE